MGLFAKRARSWVLVGCAIVLGVPLACGDDSSSPLPAGQSEGGAGGGGEGGTGGEPLGVTGGGGPVAGAVGEGGGGGEKAGEGGGSGETSGGAAPGGDGAGGEPAVIKSFPKYPEVSYPKENLHSDEKAILGKILFWDEQLSSDNTVACGTCHRAGSGGSDPRGASPSSRHPGASGDPFDDIHGAQGVKRCTASGDTITYKNDALFGMNVQVTKRRPPSYLDAMFASELFWDGRAKGTFTDPDTNQIEIIAGGALESQSVGPPLNDGEMACESRTWTLIHQKLRTAVPLAYARDLPPDIKTALAAHDTYPKLFEAAFGTTEINTKRIAFAIATHERRLTSSQTPWDRYNAGDASALTPAQRRGFELFLDKAKCALCHAPPLFTDLVFHNLGFISSDFDSGRQAISNQAIDKGKVKTPTLRNVGLRESGGLLHFGYGTGATLDAVMGAYNEPPNADGNLTDPQIERLNLTPDEIADIIDFMRHSLTDPRVAAELPPFDRPKLGSEP